MDTETTVERAAYLEAQEVAADAMGEVTRLRGLVTLLQTQALLLAGVADARGEDTLGLGLRLVAGLAGDGLKTP